MTKQQAQKVLDALEELVADPQIDFGPAYAGAIQRQLEAVRIMRDFLKTL